MKRRIVEDHEPFDGLLECRFGHVGPHGGVVFPVARIAAQVAALHGGAAVRMTEEQQPKPDTVR